MGFLDSKHVLIRPSTEKDYARIFFRRTWFVQNSPMTISKWTMDFMINKESSIAPVWVSLSGLPLPLFEKKYLLKIGSLIGRPLQVDSATLTLKRPSVASLLIDVDAANPPVRRIWIGDDEVGQ